MTRTGRKPKGAAAVDDLTGSDVGRERLRQILRAMTGEATVAEVCAELGIGESRFHQLRGEALQAAADRLEPCAAGRPAKPVDPARLRFDEMEDRIQELTWQLQAAHLRPQLAGADPVVVVRNVKKHAPLRHCRR